MYIIAVVPVESSRYGTTMLSIKIYVTALQIGWASLNNINNTTDCRRTRES